MEDSRKRDPSESAIEETLAPGESKTQALKIPPDYDFLLERITCRSDGPVLLKIVVAQPQEPTQAFSVALET